MRRVRVPGSGVNAGFDELRVEAKVEATVVERAMLR